jgi:hypothetical protein
MYSVARHTNTLYTLKSCSLHNISLYTRFISGCVVNSHIPKTAKANNYPLLPVQHNFTYSKRRFLL